MSQIKKACQMCAACNGAGCTLMDFPDPNHWICKTWLATGGKLERISLLYQEMLYQEERNGKEK